MLSVYFIVEGTSRKSTSDAHVRAVLGPVVAAVNVFILNSSVYEYPTPKYKDLLYGGLINGISLITKFSGLRLDNTRSPQGVRRFEIRLRKFITLRWNTCVQNQFTHIDGWSSASIFECDPHAEWSSDKAIKWIRQSSLRNFINWNNAYHRSDPGPLLQSALTKTRFGALLGYLCRLVACVSSPDGSERDDGGDKGIGGIYPKIPILIAPLFLVASLVLINLGFRAAQNMNNWLALTLVSSGLICVVRGCYFVFQALKFLD